MFKTTAGFLGLGAVGLLLVTGVVLRECTLLVAAAAAAYRLSLWRMDCSAPWDEWRAALRCLAIGAGGLLAAALLFVLITAGAVGVWRVDHGHPVLAIGLIGSVAALIVGYQLDRDSRLREARHWTMLILVAVAGLWAATPGNAILPCAAAAGLAGWLAWASWRLTRREARELLEMGR